MTPPPSPVEPYPALALLRAKGVRLVPVTRSSNQRGPKDIVIGEKG
jgi:hypothetical protein